MRAALLFVILALAALLAHVHQVDRLQAAQVRLLREQTGLLRQLAEAHSQVAVMRGRERSACERTLDELLAHLGIEEARPRSGEWEPLVNRRVGPPDFPAGIGGDE